MKGNVMSVSVKKLFKYVFDSNYRLILQINQGKFDHLDDETYLKLKFKACLGRDLNLEDPRSFNEKLQWIKLHDRDPKYTMMVDKYLVRDYIREKLGEEYLIPLIGAWDSPDEIDFDSLPDQFVLKCNHNSGLGMYICRDKSKMDIKQVKHDLRLGISQDYFLTGREWPYKNVSRKIICEQFLINNTEHDLKDYKIQCFNGKIDHAFVCVGRSDPQNIRYYYFDEDWNALPYSVNECNDKDFLASLKPQTWEQMKAIANKLCEGIPEIRVDLYEVNGRIYFGELTLFTSSGFDDTITTAADYEIGGHFDLPTK